MKKNLFLKILLSLVFIIKVGALFVFQNKDWEPDSYMHFLELRTIFTNFPNNLYIGLGVWSKPLYSYIFAPIVTIFQINSLFYVEIINILIFILIAYLIYRINYRLFSSKIISITSIILVSFSLTLFKSSTSTLTEGIFTLFLILGFYFMLFENIYLSSLFFGISVLGRIEGLFFIFIYLIWITYILWKDKIELIKNYTITLLPLFIWNFLGFLRTGNLLYIFKSGYPTTAGIYGYGGLLHYPKLFITKEFIISTLFIVGGILLIIEFFKFLKSKNFKNIPQYLDLKIFVFILVTSFILIQIILYKFGAFGTAGLMRYFVSVLPFMVIIGGLSLNRVSKNYLKYIAILIIFLQLLFLLFTLFGPFQSIKEFPEVDPELIDAGIWVKNNVSVDTFIGADRPEILYYANRDLNNSTIFYSNQLNSKKPGIYLWNGWSGITKQEISSKAKLLTIIDNKVFVYMI